MGGVNSIVNIGLGAQEYASLIAQRKRPETEAEGSAANNAQQQNAAVEQQLTELENAAAQARREAAAQVTCPTEREMPEIMAGLVSGIAQSPVWKLAEIQPVGKSRLVPASYV